MISEEFLIEKTVDCKQGAWSGHWTNKGNVHFILWNLLGVFHGMMIRSRLLGSGDNSCLI